MTGTSLSPRPQPLECRILLRSRVRSRPGRSSGEFPRPGKTGGNEGAYPSRLRVAVTYSKITVVGYPSGAVTLEVHVPRTTASEIGQRTSDLGVWTSDFERCCGLMGPHPNAGTLECSVDSAINHGNAGTQLLADYRGDAAGRGVAASAGKRGCGGDWGWFHRTLGGAYAGPARGESCGARIGNHRLGRQLAQRRNGVNRDEAGREPVDLPVWPRAGTAHVCGVAG